MIIFYATSITLALLPLLLYISHAMGIPFSNLMFVFGIACCSGILTYGRKLFLPSFSAPLVFLSAFICMNWGTGALVGAGLVCAVVFFITLFVASNTIQNNIHRIVTHQLVSTYYFALASMILCVALSMITEDLTHEHIIQNSIHTVFLACTIVSCGSALCLSILPKRLKALTFIIALAFGMWLCNRLGIIVAPIGTYLVSLTSQIDTTILIEQFHLPEVLPQVIAANVARFGEAFNAEPTFIYPQLIRPMFFLEPCLIMGLAGVFIACEYVLHAYTSASLRGYPTKVFFHKKTILVHGCVAILSAFFVGLPLTLSAEGNALHRIFQYKEQGSILIAGILATVIAFLGKPLWLLFAIRFPILGVQTALLAGYFIFIGIIFFPTRSKLFDVFIALPMLAIVFLYPTYFMFSNLPCPPLWICLALGMVANITYRAEK